MLSRARCCLVLVLFALSAFLGGCQDYSTSDPSDPLDPSLDRSAIQIMTHEHAEIFVMDPDSYRAGFDPFGQLSFLEIPESDYFTETVLKMNGECESRHCMLEIKRPRSGAYRIVLSSRAKEEGLLCVRAFDAAGNATDAQFFVEFDGRSKHTYMLYFDKGSGGRTYARPE